MSIFGSIYDPKNKYTEDLGDGQSKKFIVAHNLGTEKVLTVVMDKETQTPKLVGTEVIDENTVEVNFENIVQLVDGVPTVSDEVPAPYSQVVVITPAE